MRSLILTAAIAASLLSVPAVAFAASPAKPMAVKTAMTKPATLASASNVLPPKPAAYRLRHGPRLSLIVAELGKAAHRIDVERHRGALTPKEARFVRNEESSIRTTAVRVADRHGGRIPNASYAMLKGRVSDLNRTIHRYAINSARA